MICPRCSNPVTVLRMSRVSERLGGELITLVSWDEKRRLILNVDPSPVLTDQETEQFDLFCSNQDCPWFAVDVSIEVR